MNMISISHRGSLKKIEKFLDKANRRDYFKVLTTCGQKGVDALSSCTPVDSGLTANSWKYEIEIEDGKAVIRWLNTNVNNGVNIALILQYGHGTGTGGYIQGRDYINPALQPVFDEIGERAWKEVTSV